MVLQARYKAEKIGYPVVGEETKAEADVIDYDINKEITIDLSSEKNANNDTTTGMATIIPGINAPKLIQTTSILNNAPSNTGGATITGSATLLFPDDENANIRSFTISGEYGNVVFKNKTDGLTTQWNGLEIPASGRYEFYMAYPTGGSTFSVDEYVYIAKGGYPNNVLMHTYIGQRDTTQYYGTFRYYLNAGDAIYIRLELKYVGSSSSFTSNKTITVQITKL